MSSRLVILPKKSYCPWSEENVKKVLRDEEQHAREVEEAAKQTKHRRHQDDDDNNNRQKKNLVEPNGHFSLFAKEEKEAHTAQEKILKENDKRRNHQPQHRRPFDQSTSATMDSVIGLESRKYQHSRKDEAIKNRLDPMSGFCRNDPDVKSEQRLIDAKSACGRFDHPPTDRSERGRDQEQKRRRRRRSRSTSSSSSSSLSSSYHSSSNSPSQKRRRKRRRGRSGPRRRRDSSSSSSSSSTSSSSHDTSHDKRHRRRRKKKESKTRSHRSPKSQSLKRKFKYSSNTDEDGIKQMSTNDKAKHELLMRCAQREEQERTRQESLRRY